MKMYIRGEYTSRVVCEVDDKGNIKPLFIITKMLTPHRKLSCWKGYPLAENNIYEDLKEWIEEHPEIKIKLDKDKQYICEPTWLIRKKLKIKTSCLKRYPFENKD